MLALMLVATGVGLTIPLYAGRFVDAIKTIGPTVPGRLVAVLAGLLLVQLGGSFCYQVISQRVALRTVNLLRRRLFSHLLDLPCLYYASHKPGDLSSRVTSDVGSIQYVLTNGIVSLIRAVLTLVGALVLMFMVNLRLTLIVLMLVPTTVILVQLFGRRLHRLSRQMYDELGQVSDHIQELAGAIRVVKVFNSQPSEQVRFDGLLQRFLAAGLRRTWLASALESAAQLLLWGCLITVVVYGFALSGQGRTTYGQLVTFLLLAIRVASPLGTLTSLYASFQGATAAAERLDEVFQEAPEGAAAQVAAVDDHAVPGAITLAAVGFRYPGPEAAPEVIHDLSLHIAAGEKVAFVGPSGSGKTTVTGLIMRLFDPQTGVLQLDGRPYGEVPLRALRSRMAYVPQEPLLYDATVAENIRFGLAGATDDAVRDAAARAQALDFILAMPEGMASRVGPRGARLSGGEKQRLALARAFLRDPGILILDEPTSALDAASEEAVRIALRELMASRTVIVVAHRLSLVRDLDRIYVLAAGRIAEAGSHAQLIARAGLYRVLYEFQQGSANPLVGE
jgi:ATP-binding cassette, subfamily B, bacterial MsbA